MARNSFEMDSASIGQSTVVLTGGNGPDLSPDVLEKKCEDEEDLNAIQVTGLDEIGESDIENPAKNTWIHKTSLFGFSNFTWIATIILLLLSGAILGITISLGPKNSVHGAGVLANFRSLPPSPEHLIMPIDEKASLNHVEFRFKINGHVGVEDVPDTVPKPLELTIVGVQRAAGAEWTAIDGLSFKATQYTDELLGGMSAFDFKCPKCVGPKFALQFSTSANYGTVAEIHLVQIGVIGKYQVVIAGLLLILMYVGIVIEIMHRTLVAMVGMFVTLFFLGILGKAPDLGLAFGWLEEGVIVLLFGMMIIVNVLSSTGLFEFIAIRAYSLSRQKYYLLLIVLTASTAFLSAFLDNVTTMLLIAPVTMKLAGDLLGLDPRPLLIAECILSNIGGTATMIGDPPNIIIGAKLSKHIGFVDFIINLAPAVIVMYFLVTGFMLLYYRQELRKPIVIDKFEQVKKDYCIHNKGLLLKTGTVFAATLLLFFTEPVHHVNVSYIALMGAVLMLLISTPHDIAEALEHVEWDTLVFFGGLFIMIEGLAEMGLIQWIGELVKSWVAAVAPDMRLAVALIIVLWVSGLVSAFLDNIPYTATMVPVVTALAADPALNLPLKPLAWALALGACLGGNGTL
eukprot:Ihof_evm15s39 gene=Ihof_evmTU15s39